MKFFFRRKWVLIPLRVKNSVKDKRYIKGQITLILLSCLGDVSAWRRTAAGIFETIEVLVDFVIISAHLNFLKKKIQDISIFDTDQHA